MTDTSKDAIAALMAGVTPGPWAYVETESPDGQEFMGCGVLIGGHERIWFEDEPEDDIPLARFIAAARELVPALAAERDAAVARAEAALMRWQPIDGAPKDGQEILVWYDHEADPYHDPADPTRLTDYAVWSEAGDFLDGKGVCIACWFGSQWEAEDEYGSGYWLPPAWFSRENGDYERVVNPTHWMPLPAPPTGAA